MINDNRRNKVAVDAIGCKLNQAEAETLARQLAGAGYRLVSPSEVADIYILNTCTVTHIADRKCRNWLRQAHAKNPRATIIATGCYAQRAPDKLGDMEGVTRVLDNQQKAGILRLLGENNSGPGRVASLTRTRAFVKIQDGCSRFCSYCIVPLVRGSEKSVPPADVVEEIKHRVAEGYKEVVLTGTEIGAYCGDGVNLEQLLERILEGNGVARLRLSSLQPGEVVPGLVRLWQDERLCHHFHIALQSGSDSVIKRMDRRYSTGDYERAVSLIRNSVPEAAITTDVIVGFPGETEAEFRESLDFCRKMEFARIHVFPYSPRPGTRAAEMRPQVPGKVSKERSRLMLALAKESACNFHQRFLGKTMPVLWEKRVSGIWSGLTGNYIRVYFRSNEDLTNSIVAVKLSEVRAGGVLGLPD